MLLDWTPIQRRWTYIARQCITMMFFFLALTPISEWYVTRLIVKELAPKQHVLQRDCIMNHYSRVNSFYRNGKTYATIEREEESPF